MLDEVHGSIPAAMMACLLVTTLGGCSGPDLSLSPPEGAWDWSGVMTYPGAPSLGCTQQVSHGGHAFCNVWVDPASTWSIAYWQFMGETLGSLYFPADPYSDKTWGGPMVVSGEVTVMIFVDGVPHVLHSSIEVTRRSWSWANSVGGQQGSPGVIDQCVGDLVGMMSGQSCTEDLRFELFTPAVSGGHGMAQVWGQGPNGEFWYLTNPTITMQLRTQINRRFRADGDTLDVPMTGHSTVVSSCGPQRRNHYAVNNQCAPVSDYASFLNYAWNHEWLHTVAALNFAKQPTGDVHALWEPLVHKYDTDLEDDAWDLRFNAGTDISAAARCTHTGANPTFYFWRNQGSAWADSLVVVDESVPAHC
jgi:hypothetical protein